MDAILDGIDPYREPFTEIVSRIIAAQMRLDSPGIIYAVKCDPANQDRKLSIALCPCPGNTDTKCILRSANGSTVRLSVAAAEFAIEICALNWLTHKFFETGDHVLGLKASTAFCRLMQKLLREPVEISKDEVQRILRYLD
jgi:hypothetical protein